MADCRSRKGDLPVDMCVEQQGEEGFTLVCMVVEGVAGLTFSTGKRGEVSQPP